MGFVSTPEVLERFVTIEREIVQIENSLEAEGMLRDGSLLIILWMSSWPVNQLHSYCPILISKSISQTLNFN